MKRPNVRFISRYKLANDYSVDGVRVTVSDAGEARAMGGVTAEQIEAIRLYELQRYAEYIDWRQAWKLRNPDTLGALLPFDFPL